MNQDINDGERRAYAIVDDALRTQPLHPTPSDLLEKVMGRIQSRGELEQRRSSSLRWWGAVGVAAALCLTWALWSTLPLPVDWPTRLQFQLLMWQQYLNYAPPQCSLAAGIGMMLAGGMILLGLASWAATQVRF